MLQRKASLAAVLVNAAVCWQMLTGVSLAVTVFSEDFEGLPLGPNVDEATAGTTVWTKTAPAGWTIDDSGIPGVGTAMDGVTEWAGWSFANKDWWVQTAGDQNRSQFLKGSGTVAVADPDEWDDQAHPDSAASGWYKTYLSTPPISLAGAVANTAQLTFDSSWRPEFDDNYHQSARVTVSYDGGPAQEVLLWLSDSASGNFKPDATNETVTVDLGNPVGASSMVLTFGLFDAGNDWWWSVDNIAVTAVPEPSTLAMSLVGLLGVALLLRRRHQMGSR
jgi:hypothetical protein